MGVLIRLDDLVKGEDKAAIPEMRFKLGIILALEGLSLAYKELMRGYFRRGGVYRRGDVISYESEILHLFKLVRWMIKDKGVSKEFEGLYSELVRLEYSERLVSVERLKVFDEFLRFYCHKLRLTDLLLRDGAGFEDLFRREYG